MRQAGSSISKERSLAQIRVGYGAVALAGLALLCAAGSSPLRVDAQRGDMFQGSANDPAIAYATAPVNNVVDALNRRLQDGSATLTFAGRSGYLQSAIEALRLPIDSQLLLFSKGSLQAPLINPANPRALFFNDRVALGWVRDGEMLEVAAHDEKQGMVFYSLEQKPAERPVFKREFRCLGCHMSGATAGVPGLLMFSAAPGVGDQPGKAVTMTQRSPLAGRWGGWFVTGNNSPIEHLGNRVPALADHPAGALASVKGLFDADGFRGTSSDIAALLTFSHQTQMINLLTRASWEARAADPALHNTEPAGPRRYPLVEAMMSGIAEEVVDYMLFVDEAPLPDSLSKPLTGRAGFFQRMSASGPRDRHGRSLSELDLNRRLIKYPCSYLIYSPAVDALPPLAKTPIYKRLWQVLAAEVRDPRYQSLSLTDRRAIVEILEDTKPGLPAYFGTVTK